MTISLPLLLLAFVAVPVLAIPRIENSRGNEEELNITAVKNLTLDVLEKINGWFTLNNIKLTNIPDGFVESEFLTYFNLERNRIRSISPFAFKFVPRLSYLSLANNLLENIDLIQFSTMKSLRTLNLNGNCKEQERDMFNKSSTMSPIFDNPWDPREELDFNDFETPSTIIRISCKMDVSVELPNLTKLYLEYNNLKELQFSKGMNLPLLKHLYLSGNKLQIDEDMISNLNEFAPSLLDLHLKDSNIHEFNAQLPTVKSLHLDQNQISSVCNEYCEPLSLKLKGARNLETLTVSRNHISKLEAECFNFTTNLVTLDLSHNRISEIREGTFDKLHLLRSLSLEFNNLVKPNAVDMFRNLINLEKLYLGYNNISNINAKLFENLVTLKTLTLNDNEIFNINLGIFTNLTNLETLSLAGNHLSEIPDESMSAFNSLMTLDLNNNAFRTLEQCSIANLPNLQILSLKSNPLTTMYWYSSSVERKNLTIFLGPLDPYATQY